MNEPTLMESFDQWWSDEGSAIRPLAHEDREQHAHRVALAAYKEGLAECMLRIKPCFDNESKH